MSLLLRDYDYALPPELIASRPLADRAASRMMVLHRGSGGSSIGFSPISPPFCAMATSWCSTIRRVIPARAFSDDGRIEFLFLETSGTNRWLCMVKPGRKMQLGRVVSVGGVAGTVVEIQPGGERVLQFEAAR